MRRTLLVPLVLLLAVGACGKTETPPTAKPKSDVAGVAVGTGPIGITASPSGDVWVAVADADKIVKVGAAARPSDEVPVPGTPLRLTSAEGGAALWVTPFRQGAVVRVDTATLKVTDQVKVGAGAEGVAEAFGSVWVAAQDDGLLVRVDAATRKVVHKVDVGTGVRLVVPGPDALWLAEHTTGEVIAVDPETYRVRRSEHVCDGPEDLAVDAQTVWVTCSVSEELVALGAADLKVTQRIKLDGTPDAITTAPDGSLLVVLQDGPTLVRLDSSAGKELSRTRLGKQKQLYDQANVDVVVTGDDAWVTSFADRRVFRTPWRR